MDLFKGNSRAGRSEGSEPIKEKNYFFLMQDELPNINLGNYPSEKKYYGKLYLTVTALQELFIGSGQVDSRKNRLYDVFTYVKKDPETSTLNIPGSSMKGTILTNLLMFLNPKSTHFMGGKDSASSVYFSDLPITSIPDISPRTIPARFGPRIDPEKAAVKLYLKDDPAYSHLSADEIENLQAIERILTVKKDSRFEGFINFKLLGEYELAFLYLSLGILAGFRFNFKIGGAKNRAMGLIRVDIDVNRSYWTEKLGEAADEKGQSFQSLEPRLIEVVTKIKQEYPKLDTLLQKIQGEYGHA